MSDERFTVLINSEEQYALHPEHAPLPEGWAPAGFSGTEDACMEHVDTVWRDTRPLGLRRACDGGKG